MWMHLNATYYAMTPMPFINEKRTKKSVISLVDWKTLFGHWKGGGGVTTVYLYNNCKQLIVCLFFSIMWVIIGEK